MNVCLDYQSAVSQGAGIGRYTRELAAGLAACREAADSLGLFYFDFRRRAAPASLDGVALKVQRRLPGALVQQSWKRLGWPPFDRLAGPADLYHFPNFVIPPLRSGKGIVTIHDMSFMRLPECAEPRNLSYLRARLDATIERADAIIAISRFSAGEIVSFYPAAAGKVRAVPLGIEPELFQPPSPSAVARTRARLGLRRPYLLTVGTIEPRKNLALLVKCFDALESFDGDLVIAGMPGWKCEPVFSAMRQARRAGRIRYLRFVPEADLPSLYAGAELFVITSLYEGFGFPPLEAMACGAPVLSSAGGSLPEVLGQAAEIVPGFDPGEWIDRLRALLANEDRRRRLAAAGRHRASGYRWPETARMTWQIYREVCR